MKRKPRENQKYPLVDVWLAPEMSDKWYYPVLAPFSKYYTTKVANARKSLKDRIALDLMVTVDQPKVVFTKNPKAACTTVASAIYKIASGKEYQGDIYWESEVLSQGRAHWNTTETRRAMHDYTKFTFVRHPVDRAVSACRNLMIVRRNKALENHASGFGKFGYHQDKTDTENLDVLLDYIEACFDISRLRTDPHFRPQVDNIGWERFSYDFIGRVENLQDDMRTVFTMAGVEKEAIDQVTSIRKNSSRTSSRIANKAQIARIQKLYADDFEAFDYD